MRRFALRAAVCIAHLVFGTPGRSPRWDGRGRELGKITKQRVRRVPVQLASVLSSHTHAEQCKNKRNFKSTAGKNSNHTTSNLKKKPFHFPWDSCLGPFWNYFEYSQGHCLMHFFLCRCGWRQVCYQFRLPQLLWRLRPPNRSNRPLSAQGHCLYVLYSQQLQTSPGFGCRVDGSQAGHQSKVVRTRVF